MAYLGTDIESMKIAAQAIREGKLVSFPTETVYGLGADAFNPAAVARIFQEKERPSFDPLIVHISDISQLSLLTRTITPTILTLAEYFWPGPLTMVLPKQPQVHDIVTSGLDTVAIRMPNHPVALQLISLSGTVIAAPSANKFGQLSPTHSKHVAKQLKGVDYIIQGGHTSVGIESSVISVEEGRIQILRPGAITASDIKAVLPDMEVVDFTKPVDDHLPSPGLLNSHYSPKKPLYISVDLEQFVGRRYGYIAFAGDGLEKGPSVVRVLSKTGDYAEAAANLFGTLHYLEESDVDFIVAEPIKEEGVGIAIMDRLKKAAFQYKPQ
jgi:L-threonylcarbamoyladenylate synthase